MNDYMNIGQVINTHGIKGELKVYSLSDDIKRFRKLKTVILENIEMKVVWCQFQGDRVILKLEGIDTIEEAEKYKTKYLQVKKEDAVKLPEGRYFISDIIGCQVFDENNVELGNVYDVIITGSNDVYWVKGNKEVLVPALESVVVKIDINNKKIIIKPLEVWNYED